MFFKPKTEYEDMLYSRIRDYSGDIKVKKQIGKFWDTYKNIAPKGFFKEIQRKNCFHSRWWEMFCGVGLISIGFEVRTSKVEKGPDFELSKNDNRYIVEAIAPGEGCSADKLPAFECDYEVRSFDLPEKEFLLRLTSAITEKLNKYKIYLEKGIVSNQDALIIALSSCNLHQYGSLMDYPVLAPLKVLRGFGFECINLKTGRRAIAKRERISKNSGEMVDVNLFAREDMRIISALLYSNVDPLNSPDQPEKTFVLIKNTNALNPINDINFDGIRIL